MGRHSAPPPAEAPGPDAPAPAVAPTHTSLPASWRDRLVLCATAVVVTAAVILWAGGRWPLALTAGLGTGLVVVLAATLAATVPPAHHPRVAASTTDGASSGDAVQ